MAVLPPELLLAITKDAAHDPSIFNLRLVSKALNDLAKPIALRVVVVNDSVKSARAVSFLQGCDQSVTSLVRELVFCGDSETVRPQNGFNWKNEDETSGAVGRQALKTVFSALAKFRNLETLRLNFHASYQEDPSLDVSNHPDATHFLKLQDEIFATLAAHPPPPLVSLALTNLLALPSDIYAKESFHLIFRSVRQLDISALSNLDLEGSYSEECHLEFWDTSVAHMIRGATSITELTVRSDQLFFVETVKNIFLPHLVSLSLHQFILEPALPESDVVAFILRHKATLTRLELHGCSICGGEHYEFPRPWHAVLGLFEAELGALCEFVLVGEVEEGPDLAEDAYERDRSLFNYTNLNPGIGYMPHEQEVPTEGLDLPALESLMAVVRSRRDSVRSP
ncbi:hypothetical protein MSAN_02116800 [Mycena sanguinolenta]|uniref:F-box domain-containing protein n=1 Tax=Mycena sanguinolenta TaxID=230812 RepID=A0A8H7CMN0_9AGAR|nr:hypothetical protein MSAN_02116800 [Mycena sanguinolenta]